MTGRPAIDIALAILGAIAGAYGIYAGGRKALADARATKTPSTPYEALAARVVTLEQSDAAKGEEMAALRDRVSTLEAGEGRLVRWLRQVRFGVASGAIPPWPADPDWWEELDARHPD